MPEKYTARALSILLISCVRWFPGERGERLYTQAQLPTHHTGSEKMLARTASSDRYTRDKHVYDDDDDVAGYSEYTPTKNIGKIRYDAIACTRNQLLFKEYRMKRTKTP